MRSRAAAAAAALSLLAACNGDGGDAAGTTTDVPTTTAPSSDTTTPSPDPTTSRPEPTTTTTTATTIGETTTTTAVPASAPTSDDPDDYAAQAQVIFDQIEGGWETSVLLARDPFNDDLRTRLDEYFTGAQLEGRRSVNDRYRNEDLYELENPEVPDSIDVDPFSFAMNDARTSATVQACEVTSGLVYQVGGNPDGTDKLVEDGIDRTVVEFSVVRVDGTWKIASGRAPEGADRIAACD